MKFERVYHHYLDWEENDYNMWGSVVNKKAYLEKAIEFTGDHKKYGRFMIKVIENWKISCENALTDYSLNRKAWVGHAACALALGCPEDITREAWGKLTDEQQLLANKKASRAIQLWEVDYLKSGGVCIDMGGTLL
jgi:hypothetical protein